MENTNDGITMSAGIVSPINGFGRVESKGGNSNSSISSQMPISISEYRESKKAKMAENHAESASEVGKIIDEKLVTSEKVERKTKLELADEIFEFAKKEGIEKTFERLAKGEFVKEEQVTDRKSQIEEKSERQATPETSELNAEKQEVSPLEAQVIALEERVNELTGKNQELTKKVAEVQALAKTSAMTALELAQVLKKLIEDEEDEEKKKKHQNLLEFLIKKIAELLIILMVPEKGQDEAMEGLIEKAA